MKRLLLILLLIASPVFASITFENITADYIKVPQDRNEIAAIGDSSTLGSQTTSQAGWRYYVNQDRGYHFTGWFALPTGFEYSQTCSLNAQTSTVLLAYTPKCLGWLMSSNTHNQVVTVFIGFADVAACNSGAACTDGELTTVKDNIMAIVDLALAKGASIEVLVINFYHFGAGWAGAGGVTNFNTAIDTLNSKLSTAVTGYDPRVTLVDIATGWNTSTMLHTDFQHPNDTGASYIATQIEGSLP